MNYFPIKLAYLSSGNIPSRFAHTIQIMRMSEELSQVVSKFCLITAIPEEKNKTSSKEIHDFYGTNDFPIIFISNENNKYFINALNFLNQWKVDVVMTRCVIIAKYCLKQNLRVILETHITHQDPFINKLKNLKKYSHLLSIITERSDLRSILTREGTPREIIKLLPQGISNKKTPHLKKSELRKKLGLPCDEFIILYSGHLFLRKGIDIILQTAEKLPKIRFYILGGTEEDIFFWKKCTQYLNINFLGFESPSKVHKYLQASDILLLTNNANELDANVSSPLKLFEYIQAKRPIICSSTLYIKNFLSHELEALIVPHTPKDFMEAIEKLKGRK